MSKDGIIELFSDLIRKWRAADSQRAIFGVNMIQTQNAIKGLALSLQTVLEIVPKFSLVKKEQDIEVIISNIKFDNGESETINIPTKLPSLLKVFIELKINSISISKGLTEQELKDLFHGISMTVEEMEVRGGLREFLRSQGDTHIQVDQVKFKLLRDTEQIGDGGDRKKQSKEDKKKAADLVKAHDSLWKDYINGKLDKEEFKSKHKDLIEAASKDPQQIEKIVKRLMAKQREAEKFLARLEQKLFDVGFKEKDVETLKKKLLKPKKVMIEESELARLRKIEQEYLKSPDQQMESTLEILDTIKEKLSQETARSEAMVHQMGQGGMILDNNSKILSINATAQKVLGFKKEEILGKTVKEVLKPHHILTSISDWQSESETFTPKEIKVQALSDETLAVIRESAIVIENETGRAVGVLSALQNVTQQEELNRRKNDILDVLGHDLRAPLSSIKMNFDVLAEMTHLDTADDEQQKKFYKNCQTSINRMYQLIEKILDTRQLEAGKIILKYDTVDTNTLLEQATMSLKQLAQNKNINLQVDAKDLPKIDGDPERLYQVITNLVTNALKFTPEDGIITARGETVKENGHEFIEVSVTDTGLGISKENIAKIFDKYEQVTADAPKGVRGLGLGLSICKAIVDLHGGNIWVESELEKGSTFTFRVPVKKKDGE